MRGIVLLRVWLTMFVGLSGFGGTQTVDPELYSSLKWRNVGPFRGGRVSAVTGVIGHPGVYYMGLPLGGVWKSTSAGTTWEPIFDSVKEASCVGAIEVAPSDPNVIYVGMGDLITGGGINEGNGVYKSTDAGKTWQHLGLDETRQIPSILVDPKDPNLVLVAAQGNIRAKSESRGLFRSTDGGKTWTRTLFVDDETGVQKITWAFDNPKVMLATTVRHYIAPSTGGRGGGGFGGAFGGSSGTKLFKSTDQGVTWNEITGGGLPELAGRTSVAIANGTNSQRMFLVGNFGLYRSDDGGTSWRQMDPTDRRVANGQGGYNCGVYVNPKNPDIVYVVNTCLYRSLDGGNTFTGFKGAPGGDDPQQLWFDPTDGNRIFLGADQGATITLDGGLSWSSWYNQATAQVYHISVDNQYPYWIYATQQDSGSIGTASRGNLGAVTPLDWVPHPGYEFGSIVADPLNPRVTYAGGGSGGIVKVTYPSGQWIDVSPIVDSNAKLRKVGNQPLIFSPTNPRELFAGFQYLMSTTDGGKHWKKLSPDLGYPKGVEPPKPGQATPPRPGGSVVMGFGDDEEREMEEQQANAPGGSIEAISPSSVDGNVIWVATNNGLVKLTQNHGKTWEDVSIPNLPNANQADICAIDASHHDPAAAYLAIDYHRTGDYTPWFFRTQDFGKTWTKIVDGLPTSLPSGSFSRVIRADTVRKGLVFAGTESFVYVSFDDGDHWQSLALNLPNTSYRDMVVHGNDLVVGTYGRSFWILDDLSPLREVQVVTASEAVHLFQPGSAIRVRRNVGADTPFPPEVPHAVNPPVGVFIDYWLKDKPGRPITIEVLDGSGRVVRHLSSSPIPPLDEPPPPIPDFWVGVPKPLPAEAGSNRATWDLRYDSPPAFSHGYSINANPGETPPSPEGPLVLPGTYTIRLTVDGKTVERSVKVANDPRSPATPSDLARQGAFDLAAYGAAKEAWDAYGQVAAMRASIATIVKGGPSPDVEKAASDLDSKLAAVAGVGGGRRFGGGGQQATSSTFASVHGMMIRLLESSGSGDMAPNEPMYAALDGAMANMKDVAMRWKKLSAEDIAAFNALLVKSGLKALPTPSAASLEGLVQAAGWQRSRR